MSGGRRSIEVSRESTAREGCQVRQVASIPKPWLIYHDAHHEPHVNCNCLSPISATWVRTFLGLKLGRGWGTEANCLGSGSEYMGSESGPCMVSNASPIKAICTMK